MDSSEALKDSKEVQALVAETAGTLTYFSFGVWIIPEVWLN